MSQEVRSISIEHSAKEETTPRWVVQDRAARYPVKRKSQGRVMKLLYLIFES